MGVALVLHQGRTEDFLTPPAHATASQLTVAEPWRMALCYLPVTGQKGLREGRRNRKMQPWSPQGCPNGTLEGRGELQGQETDKSWFSIFSLCPLFVTLNLVFYNIMATGQGQNESRVSHEYFLSSELSETWSYISKGKLTIKWFSACLHLLIEHSYILIFKTLPLLHFFFPLLQGQYEHMSDLLFLFISYHLFYVFFLSLCFTLW